MRTYALLFSRRGTKLPAFSALIARLPFGMTPLALVFLVEEVMGSYGAAGLVSGAHAVGIGVAGPVAGRLVDRFGQTRVLVPAAVLYATLLTLLVRAVQPGPLLPVVGLAFVAGLAFPPIAACARTAWASYLGGTNLRDVAYAIDSVIVELAFVIGPLVVAGVLAFATPAAAALLSGGLSLLGTLIFATTEASRTAVNLSNGVRRPAGGALRSPGVRSMVGTFAAMSIAFGVVEVGIPAFADQIRSEDSAGILLSTLAAGSLVGGLFYGGRRWPGSVGTRYRALLLTFGVGLAVLPLAPNVPTMAVALFIAGLALAPTIITSYLLIEEAALAGTVTEAFSWTTTANVIGTAIGTALAGGLADLAGARVALIPATLAVLVAATIAWFTRETIDQGGWDGVAADTTVGEHTANRSTA